MSSLTREQLRAELAGIEKLLESTAELAEARHDQLPERSWARVWYFVLGIHLRLCVTCCCAARRELKGEGGGNGQE